MLVLYVTCFMSMLTHSVSSSNVDDDSNVSDLDQGGVTYQDCTIHKWCGGESNRWVTLIGKYNLFVTPRNVVATTVKGESILEGTVTAKNTYGDHSLAITVILCSDEVYSITFPDSKQRKQFENVLGDIPDPGQEAGYPDCRLFKFENDRWLFQGKYHLIVSGCKVTSTCTLPEKDKTEHPSVWKVLETEFRIGKPRHLTVKVDYTDDLYFCIKFPDEKKREQFENSLGNIPRIVMRETDGKLKDISQSEYEKWKKFNGVVDQFEAFDRSGRIRAGSNEDEQIMDEFIDTFLSKCPNAERLVYLLNKSELAGCHLGVLIYKAYTEWVRRKYKKAMEDVGKGIDKYTKMCVGHTMNEEETAGAVKLLKDRLKQGIQSGRKAVHDGLESYENNEEKFTSKIQAMKNTINLAIDNVLEEEKYTGLRLMVSDLQDEMSAN